ncbi:hypothetical protein [Trabulsiella odontotermitis]|uniref:Uncharacterized protein n=1 Tax=Trabulsiella odontotermitis TaxID=379893 RepID=A0A0L0GYL1_9ENTR|nr:hypothetical protein [Trabulsiella odontotermitis]KNC93796.1 hypothetical protein GM31_17950 [Trabulsiella odontotermitis]
MANLLDEKKMYEMTLLAIKGAMSEATPEQQQSYAACRQLIAEMIDKYGDYALVALQVVTIEQHIKEG